MAWSTQPRKEGGLGPDLVLPLVADKSMQIAREYGVLIEEEGIALRGLFLIDPNGILRYAPNPHNLPKVIIIHRRSPLTKTDHRKRLACWPIC